MLSGRVSRGVATAHSACRAGRKADGKLIATGGTCHAATDHGGVPRRMPQRMVALLSAARRA